MSLSKQYTKEVKDRFNYSAVWLPNVVVEPGDVGKIANYQFEHLTNLGKLGIDFETSLLSPELDNFEFLSEGSISVNTKLSGDLPVAGSCFSVADGGLSIKFLRERATVFRLTNCASQGIVDVYSLGKQILQLYDKKQWTKDMVVVTEVVKASSATILISNSANAELDLLAKGQVGPKGFSLADIDSNFEVVRNHGLATEIIAQKGLTPLFKTFGLKKPLFKPVTTDYDEFVTGIGTVGYGNARYEKPVRIPANQIRFENVDYSDFDESDPASIC
jgi:hypothetical protein